MKLNFKKLIAVVMVVLMVATLMTGCVSKKKLNSASFAAAGTEPIGTVLDKCIEEAAETEAKLTYKWKSGWKGEEAPEKSLVTDGAKAVTLVLVSEEDGEKGTINVYMLYAKEANTLAAVGGYMDAEGEKSAMSALEANALIVALYIEAGAGSVNALGSLAGAF